MLSDRHSRDGTRKASALALWVAVFGAAFGGGACNENEPGSANPSVNAAGAANTAGATSSGGLAGASGSSGTAGAGLVAGSGGTAGAAGGSGGTAGLPGSGGGAGLTGGGGTPPISVTCGDGIRGVLDEECDDGNTNDDDACRSDCRTNDFLMSSGAARFLGWGRHPVAAGDSGFATVFVEPATSPRVMLRALDSVGASGPPPLDVGDAAQSVAMLESDPVVAALPGGQYAVAWTDFDGDGDELGIAVRLVQPSILPTGEPNHANSTTDFSQFDADILWTGTKLVVAWADDSSFASGPDLKVRTFSASLTESSAEATLAATPAPEGNVALGMFGGTWAAAWRTGAGGGFERVDVTAGSLDWSIGPHLPGPSHDKPALVELDATTLLVVFTQGNANGGSTLRGAILDTATPGNATSFSLEPATGGPTQSHPNAVRVGSRRYLAWRSSSIPGDSEGENLWLRELVWVPSTLTLGDAMSLPRWPSHVPGDQRFPALAASPLGPEGALVIAWDDYGQVFGGVEGKPDVVAQLVPAPILRLPGAGGGGQ